ncbi:cobalamin biosynthesis protein [Fodinicola feengrottensis]|uniref:Cobalamin biosynthesis protein CobD n=1 Tax=Fodinicola feengrottensis TaxID=435914 RepID=A0ABN2FZ64_9ACTN|nr:cobalamin biosynthesis protein [Fodinicola feengrottensis]
MAASRWTLPVGLLAGTLLDLALADPRRGHPVAAFGQVAAALERRVWADSRRSGAVYGGALVSAAGLTGVVLARTARTPLPAIAMTAAGTWAVLGGTSLAREGARMRALLAADDLAGARTRLSHLCGRDAAGLGVAELSRATVESIAENTSDAVVAPLFWGAVAGVPGLLAYRAINTLDAMIGHHNERYERFGWAVAKLDDLVNWVPARLTGFLAAALAGSVDGSPRAAVTAMIRDGGRHPSPNAGQCEAAFAGALGVRLGGVNRYGDRVEIRGVLGDGREPTVQDIGRAVRLSRLVGVAAAILFAMARKVAT